MTNPTRRTLLRSAAIATLGSRLARPAAGKLLIGVTDWNLKLDAKVEAVSLAAKLGFDGVQISFGRKIVDDKLPLDNPEMIGRYLQAATQNHCPIDGTCVDRLHDNGLKSDPKAPQWVLDSIRLTKALKTSVLLLPFFGRWSLQTRAEMDYTGDALRDLARQREKEGG